MELKLARTELTAKPKSIALDKLLETIKENGSAIFYFDKTNSHKDLMSAIKKFESEGLSVYLKEIRYGLDQEDYLYQVHAL
jgi:predicted mannosyl-3-phosphoglycerate phosphatase (HAD superfamily)